MASVTREEFNELKELVLKLSKKLDGLGSSKKTPKNAASKTSHWVVLEEYIKIMEKGEQYSCSYCPKIGTNKDKFCSSTSRLYFKGVEITEELKDLVPEDFPNVRCHSHYNKATNKANDRGANLLKAHYGKINDDTVVVKNEDEPDEQIASILTGNTVNVVTTPSKAMPKKVDDNYIDQGDFLDEYITREETTVIVRYHKSKNNTPKKRPSPVILGICDDFDKNDYLGKLKAPSDKIKASMDLKYAPLEKEEKKEEEPDISAGLSNIPKVINIEKKEEDNYDAKTDDEEDEDIKALLDDLKSN